MHRVSLVGKRPHCTCPGFQYREECKHTHAILEVACLWDSEDNPLGCAKMVDGKCPMCGGPVVEVVRNG